MSNRFRIPITAITVFGASVVLAVSIGIVLYLGFSQAATSTRQLWAEQSETLMSAMEQSLDYRLSPIQGQASFIAENIHDLSDLSALDNFMSGAMAASPQVSGMAVVRADGRGRRWLRDSNTRRDEDWSQRPEIIEWINSVREQGDGTWRAPIWAVEPIGTATLLHDVALYDEQGEFAGAFAQIIPVHELSHYLSRTYSDTGITPFVLYNRNFVLSHPAMIAGEYKVDPESPLPTIEQVGDIILTRMWTPDEETPFISPAMKDTKVVGTRWGDDYYLYLYRDIDHYGPAPWTLGAYINGSIIGADESRRLFNALFAGIAVLVLAIIASVIVGRKVSSPIKAIVRATEAVDQGHLDTVPRLTGSHVRELDDAGSAFNKMVHGLRERRLIRETLGRFVPEEVASSLLAGGGDIEPTQTEATILFCDIESFTQLTESLGPAKMVDVLNAYFSSMVSVLEEHGGVVTQFQGDAILATFNVPIPNADHANNAVTSAREMLKVVESTRFAGEKINMRVGINTGTVVAGAIGAEGRLNYTVHGDAVNLAARLESLNKEHGTRLIVSAHTAELADRFSFSHLAETTVRGQSQSIKLYTLTS